MLFRSDAVAVRLEGPSAASFRERVLPLLDGTRSLADVGALLPDLPLDDLRQHLDALVRANVLRRDEGSAAPPDPRDEPLAPFLNFLDALGLPRERARPRLRDLRVAVLGLEGPGAHAASVLAASGIGHLVLVDPFPCHAGNLALMPSFTGAALGRPRQDVVREALDVQGGPTVVDVATGDEVTRAGVHELARDVHLLVSCFDRGFSSASHWVNAASSVHHVPAVHAQLRGPKAFVGPVVVPGATACYMCWRMRDIACDDDYAATMAHEELLDSRRQPGLHERGVFPALAPYVGSMLAAEALKLLLLPNAGGLVGKVHEFDVLEGRTEVHPVLQVPNCPVCRKKAESGPTRDWVS